MFRQIRRNHDMSRLVGSIAQDIHFALRMIRCSLSLSSLIIVSLGLGIGATIAIFSVMYALAFRQLPVPDPDQLVTVEHAGGLNSYSYTEWELLRERQDILSGVSAFNGVDTTFEIGNPEQPHEVTGLYVSGDYFKTLEVSAVLGRVLEASDDKPGSQPVCIIGYGLWRQLYAESRDVLGRSLRVNGHTVQIVGVVPRSFFGIVVGYQIELYMSLQTERTFSDYQQQYGRQTPSLGDPNAKLLRIIGRLKPGVSLTQTNAGLGVLAPEMYEALSPRLSNKDRGRSIRRTLVARSMNGRSDNWVQDEDLVLLLMVMAAVALIVACANIGNLLLARATRRQNEIATRLALGATRWRIVRQLLTESIVLSIMGTVAGLFIAHWGSRALQWGLSWPDNTLSLDLSWDTRLVAFTLSITLVCSLLFGLTPAIRASRVSLYSAINDGAATPKRGNRLSNSILITLQVAMSMALLVSAVLLARTLYALITINPGYDARGVLMAHATINGNRESPQREAFTGEAMLTAFRSLPSVTSASWSRVFSGAYLTQLKVSGQNGSGQVQGSYLIFVSSDFFRTRRTSVLVGREFRDTDTETSLPVAVLSKELAKMLFGRVNVVGRRFREKDGNGRDYPVEVVGVTTDIQYRRPSDGMLPILYRPVRQCADLCSGIGDYEIRAATRFAETAGAVRSAASAIDGRVVLKCEPLSDVISNSVHRNYAMALIAVTFSLFVGLLVLIGVYGVTAFTTSQRACEIGIRLALGAQSGDIFRMVLGETITVVSAGIVLGVGAGFGAAQMIRELLWGVTSTDPLTFISAACTIFVLAGIAAFLPARRATLVDPMVTLRFE